MTPPQSGAPLACHRAPMWHGKSSYNEKPPARRCALCGRVVFGLPLLSGVTRGRPGSCHTRPASGCMHLGATMNACMHALAATTSHDQAFMSTRVRFWSCLLMIAAEMTPVPAPYRSCRHACFPFGMSGGGARYMWYMPLTLTSFLVEFNVLIKHDWLV